MKPKLSELETRNQAEPPLTEIQRLRALLNKTSLQTPSSEDKEALRQFLSENPDLYNWVGLAWLINHEIMEKLAPSNWGSQELFRSELQAIRRDLGQESVHGLERLLIERVITCWLHLRYAELDRISTIARGASYKECDIVDKMLTRAPSL